MAAAPLCCTALPGLLAVAGGSIDFIISAFFCRQLCRLDGAQRLDVLPHQGC